MNLLIHQECVKIEINKKNKGMTTVVDTDHRHLKIELYENLYQMQMVISAPMTSLNKSVVLDAHQGRFVITNMMSLMWNVHRLDKITIKIEIQVKSVNDFVDVFINEFKSAPPHHHRHIIIKL